MGYMYWLPSVLSRFFGGGSAGFFGKPGRVSRAWLEGRGALKLKAEKKTEARLARNGLRFFSEIFTSTTAGTAASGSSSETDIGGHTKTVPAHLVYVIHFYLFSLFL
jgi:hypothetical protein